MDELQIYMILNINENVKSYRFKFLVLGRGLSFINVICSTDGAIPTFNVTDLEQVTPDVPQTSFFKNNNNKIDILYNNEI